MLIRAVVVGDYAMDQIVDSRTVLLHNIWCAAGFIGMFCNVSCFLSKLSRLFLQLLLKQESRVVTRKSCDAAAVLFGLTLIPAMGGGRLDLMST